MVEAVELEDLIINMSKVLMPHMEVKVICCYGDKELSILYRGSGGGGYYPDFVDDAQRVKCGRFGGNMEELYLMMNINYYL